MNPRLLTCYGSFMYWLTAFLRSPEHGIDLDLLDRAVCAGDLYHAEKLHVAKLLFEQAKAFARLASEAEDSHTRSRKIKIANAMFRQAQETLC